MFSLANREAINKVTTMSSREVAELTGKQHKHVVRDIEVMVESLGLVGPNLDFNDFKGFSVKHKMHLGRKVIDCYLLEQDLTMTLVMGYSIPLRHRVAKRWRELEDQQGSTRVPQSLPDALRLAADLAEEKQKLQSQVNLLENQLHEDAIEFERVTQEIDHLKNLFTEGMTTPAFCKMLNGVNINQANRYLEARNWLYNDGKSGWRVTSYARDKYMTERQNIISRLGHEDFVKFEPRLLRKGAQRIYELYLKGDLPMKQTWDGRFTHDKAVRIAE